MRSIVLVLSILFTQKFLAQNSFERSFGTAGFNDHAAGICATNDKGFVVLGKLGNSTYLLKTDSLGIKQWSMSYSIPEPYLDLKRNVLQTSDGGYAFCGTANFNSNGNKGYIIKISSSGALQWIKAYSQIELLNNIRETFDGGFIAAGNAPTYMGNVLIKTDATGNILWSKQLNQTVFGRFSAQEVIQLRTDSAFIVSYFYSPPPATMSYLVLAKYDKNGSLQWVKRVTNQTLGAPYDMGDMVERDNGEIQLHRTGSSQGVFIIKPDGSSGKAVSVNTSFFNFYVRSSISLKNDIYVLGEHNLGNVQYYTYNSALAKMDSSGALKWVKQYGGANDDISMAMAAAKNKGICFVGHTKSFSSGYFDISMIKTDTMGNSCHSPTVGFISSSTSLTIVPFTPTLSALPGTTYFIPTISATNASDVLNNPCICKPPVAQYTVQNGCVIDNSLWVDKWYWTYSNGFVDSTTINSCPSFSVSGNYTVCLKVKNACGTDSLCKPYTVIIWGVKENSLNGQVICYPNPATSYIHFQNKQSKVIERIVVFDIQGRKIYEGTGDDKIYIGDLTKGVYQVYIYSGDQVFRNKFVKE